MADITQAQLDALRTGLDQVLSQIQNAVTQQVSAEDLPLIGSALSGAAQATSAIVDLSNLIESVLASLASAATTAEETLENTLRQALQNNGYNPDLVDAVVNGDKVELVFGSAF